MLSVNIFARIQPFQVKRNNIQIRTLAITVQHGKYIETIIPVLNIKWVFQILCGTWYKKQ